LIPLTLGIVCASTLAGQYMGKTGRYKILPMIGASLLTLGMLGLTQLARDTGPWPFSIMLVVVGLGMGCIFPVVTTAVQNAVPRETLGTATAAGILVRQCGGALAMRRHRWGVEHNSAPRPWRNSHPTCRPSSPQP
jgi:MFS family permease